MDNGDPFSHDSYRGNSRKAFHGLALAIVQAGAEGGKVRVNAAAAGLKEAALTLEVVKDADSSRPAVIGLDH